MKNLLFAAAVMFPSWLMAMPCADLSGVWLTSYCQHASPEVTIVQKDCSNISEGGQNLKIGVVQPLNGNSLFLGWDSTQKTLFWDLAGIWWDDASKGGSFNLSQNTFTLTSANSLEVKMSKADSISFIGGTRQPYSFKPQTCVWKRK